MFPFQNQTTDHDHKNLDLHNPSSVVTVNTNPTINTSLHVPEEFYNQHNYLTNFEEDDEVHLPNCWQHMIESLKEPLFDPFSFPKLQITPPDSQISSIPLPFIFEGSLKQSYHQQNQNQLLSVRNRTKAKRKTSSMKKKNQTVRLVQVPFDEKITSRYWRKYGQKPIKDSPHPRGYYRCSIHEGCLARKRVERKKSNPDFIIITYTGNHNHPLSLNSDDCKLNDAIFKSNEGDNNINKNKSKECVHVSWETNKLVEAKISEDKSDDGDIDNNNVFDDIMDDSIFEGLEAIVDLPNDMVYTASSVAQSFQTLSVRED